MWVLFTAKLPGWALTSIALVLAIGVVMFVTGVALARRQHRDIDALGPVRRLIAQGREGLAVMRSPVAAARAGLFQFAGWTCQLFAVWATMRAFHIYEHLSAAGLVLVLINVATIFPLWPGNFGLVQIAVALPLVNYGVAYPRGVAFGIGLQAIEASVGVGVGLIFLTREGLSYATLKEFEQEESDRGPADTAEREAERDQARRSVQQLPAADDVHPLRRLHGEDHAEGRAEAVDDRRAAADEDRAVELSAGPRRGHVARVLGQRPHSVLPRPPLAADVWAHDERSACRAPCAAASRGTSPTQASSARWASAPSPEMSRRQSVCSSAANFASTCARVQSNAST